MYIAKTIVIEVKIKAVAIMSKKHHPDWPSITPMEQLCLIVVSGTRRKKESNSDKDSFFRLVPETTINHVIVC